MEKLELKHLAPYLPYQLEFINIYKLKRDKRNPLILNTLHQDIDSMNLGNEEKSRPINNKHFKPILRPLSDLTKEIEHNGIKFTPSKIMELPEFWDKHSIDTTFFMDVQEMIKWHFDVFGLIEKNLAIDINQLNK